MSDKKIMLTEKQYECLVSALSIRPSTSKTLSLYVNDLVAELPPTLIKDVNKRMKAKANVKTKPEDYLGSLIIIDSQKRRAANLVSEFEETAREYPTLFSNTLDLIFVDKDKKTRRLGKLIKSRMAIGSALAGLNHQATMQHYVSLFMSTSSFDSEEVVRTFFESHLDYSKDVLLLSRLASSVNRGANMFAVKYADDSILPFLVNVNGKNARALLESRIKEISD
jgi:hypothetical protein